MILDQFKLEGRVAVITGGNRGLGLSLATALAEAGADIVSVQHRAEAPALAERIAPTGRRLLPLAADLTDDGAAQRVLDATLAHFGHVEILVNNAGIQRRAPAADFPLSDWDAVLTINLRAVWLFAQTFGRQMLRQGYGKIINIASVQSLQGGLYIPAYTASKHAVAGLTRSLCNEWASQGVNVNAIAPGYFDTEMTAALRADPVRSRTISERIPANRWGKPEDLAGAVVFLASPASDYVNGQLLVVDGGWMAR